MTIVFDKLAAVRRLEQAEFSRPQAEAMTDVFHDAVHGAVATKADLGELRAEGREFAAQTATEFAALRVEMRNEFTALRTEMKNEFAAVRSEMKGDLAAVRSEMKGDLAAVRSEMKGDSASVRAEVKGEFAAVRSELREQRNELKLWTAGAALAVVGALGTLMSVLLRARGLG